MFLLFCFQTKVSDFIFRRAVDASCWFWRHFVQPAWAWDWNPEKDKGRNQSLRFLLETNSGTKQNFRKFLIPISLDWSYKKKHEAAKVLLNVIVNKCFFSKNNFILIEQTISNWEIFNCKTFFLQYDDESAVWAYTFGKSVYGYACMYTVMKEIKKRIPPNKFQPRTILDFGSGVGTSIWWVFLRIAGFKQCWIEIIFQIQENEKWVLCLFKLSLNPKFLMQQFL